MHKMPAGNDAPHTGRARAPPGHFSKGVLVATSAGIAPAASHPGIAVEHQPHVNNAMRNRRPEDESHQGRRHIDPRRFTDLSDEAKRAEGRIGKAHVPPPAHYGRGSHLISAGGGVIVQNGSPQSRTAQPVRNNSTSTSIQVAEARLRRIQRENPEYSEAAAEALRTLRNDPDIVGREGAISHQIAAAAYADGSSERMAQVEASRSRRCTQEENAVSALGAPTAAIQNSVPYALVESTARKDTVEGVGAHHRAIVQNRNQCSTQEAPRPYSAHRRYDNGPVPYDTSRVSGDQYPSPPPVGVRMCLYQKPLGVKPSAQHNRGCTEDADTIALKRARGARGPSQSSEQPPDFIFGTEMAAPDTRQKTLRERTEARWKNQENELFERQTGRARTARHNAHTPLW